MNDGSVQRGFIAPDLLFIRRKSIKLDLCLEELNPGGNKMHLIGFLRILSAGALQE